MKTWHILLTLLAAGCSDPIYGGKPQADAPCGSSTGGVMGSLEGCQAVSIDSMKTSRITLTNLGYLGNEGDLATTTIQLGSQVGLGTYAMGANVKSYASTLTRAEDGRLYVLAYDSADKTKTLGTMSVTVTNFVPNPALSVELYLTGHYTATYVPPAGASYTDTATVTLDF